MSGLITIDIACANMDEAHLIADQLVSERLAACAQISPIRSVYRWQGQIESSPEVRVSLKTVAAQFGAIEARVTALHSYELPQIIASDITVSSKAFAAWVRANSDGSDRG